MILLSETELSDIRNSTDNQVCGFLNALRERTKINTAEDTLVQKNDTQEWWHLVCERISDAAFIYRLDRDENVAKWLHSRVLEICALPVDEWIGPWYRDHKEPKTGAL